MSAGPLGTAQTRLTDEYFHKCRKAASILKQVFHSKSCDGTCCQSTCTYFKRLLDHMKVCDVANCKVSGCETTKKLLEHHTTCTANKNILDLRESKVCMICHLVSAPEKNINNLIRVDSKEGPLSDDCKNEAMNKVTPRVRSRSIDESDFKDSYRNNINSSSNISYEQWQNNTSSSLTLLQSLSSSSTTTTMTQDHDDIIHNNDNDIINQTPIKRSRSMTFSIVDSITSHDVNIHSITALNDITTTTTTTTTTTNVTSIPSNKSNLTTIIPTSDMNKISTNTTISSHNTHIKLLHKDRVKMKHYKHKKFSHTQYHTNLQTSPSSSSPVSSTTTTATTATTTTDQSIPSMMILNNKPLPNMISPSSSTTIYKCNNQEDEMIIQPIIRENMFVNYRVSWCENTV